MLRPNGLDTQTALTGVSPVGWLTSAGEHSRHSTMVWGTAGSCPQGSTPMHPRESPLSWGTASEEKYASKVVMAFGSVWKLNGGEGRFLPTRVDGVSSPN
ncbi:MAG: hypothetical protein ACE5G7_03825 [Candidatus Hydrothermarchaeaceae archaeon]